MQKLLADVILVSYLRLIQMILIAIIFILCGPLVLIARFLRTRTVAADGSIIKNLNKVPFEEFKSFKKFIKSARNNSSTSSDQPT